MNKQYFKYLCKQNKGLIILTHFIAFVVIFLITMVEGASGALYYFEGTSMMGYILGCFYAFLAPIYLFSFMQKKTSAQTYFALPIKKETLFITTTMFSMFISIIPFVFWSFITGLLVVAPFTTFCTTLILQMITLVAIHTISVLICQLCTNVLDSLMCNGAYVILPQFIYLAVDAFLSNCLDKIVIGGGSYLSDIDDFIFFLSPGLTGLVSTQLTFFIQLFIYWIVVSVILMIVAYKLFIQRKTEDAENHTKSIFIYPVIMSVITLSLLLFGLGDTFFTAGEIIWMIFIFIIYLLMYFFWKRKVTFNIKIPALFALMIVAAFALQQSFILTKGFGMIQEVPTATNLESMRICVDNDYNGKNICEQLILDKEDILQTYQFHKDIVESKETLNCRNGYMVEEDTYSLTFTYNYNDGSTKTMSYVSNDTQLLKDYCLNTLNENINIEN